MDNLEETMIGLLRRSRNLTVTREVHDFIIKGYIEKIDNKSCNCGDRYQLTDLGKEKTKEILIRYNLEHDMKRCIECGNILNYRIGIDVCNNCRNILDK